MAGQTKLMLPSGGSVSISASDSTQNTTVTLPGGDVTLATTSQVMGRNRIINGDMRIDQRNAGASVTPTNIATATYSLDRWNTYGSVASKFSIQQNAGSITPPVGFTNYLGITSLSSYTVGAGEYYYLQQPIEGFNCCDLAWGTANAATVTLSFVVRSSKTGTFSGSLANSAFSRSYPFTYTVTSSNTWTKISVSIPGDTSGTWLTNNGTGVFCTFNFGSGATPLGTAGAWASAGYVGATSSTGIIDTNGATFYITGVQLEKATTATPFEFRPYGQELALCQRYCVVVNGTNNYRMAGQFYNTTAGRVILPHYVTMRSAPTLTVSGLTGQAIGNGPTTFTGNNTNQILGVDASSWDLTGATVVRSAFQPLTYDGTATLSAEL